MTPQLQTPEEIAHDIVYCERLHAESIAERIADAIRTERSRALVWPDEGETTVWVAEYIQKYGYRPNECSTIAWCRKFVESRGK